MRLPHCPAFRGIHRGARSARAMLAALAVMGVAGTLIAPAHATAPIAFDEAVSGDVDTYTAALDPLGQPTRTFFVLGAGNNTFAGSLLAPGDTSDVIPFEIPTGLTVTALSVTLANTQFLLSSPVIDLEHTFGNVYYHGALAAITAPLALQPGDYTLLLGNGLAGTGYTVTLPGAASAVPEPAGWALLLTGIAATGAALRRRGRAWRWNRAPL